MLGLICSTSRGTTCDCLAVVGRIDCTSRGLPNEVVEYGDGEAGRVLGCLGVLLTDLRAGTRGICGEISVV